MTKRQLQVIIQGPRLKAFRDAVKALEYCATHARPIGIVDEVARETLVALKGKTK